jgi:hypothetical protein
VSINAINNGWPYGTSPNSHPELYRNNALPDGGGQINTEMDGLTRVLTCVAKVNKGVKNHIKLAVADVYDGLFDSNVFIGTGALTTVPPPPIPVPQARAVVTMTPDCVNGGMNVTLDGTSSSEPGGQLVSYQWFYGGITPVGTGPVVTFYRNPGASGPMSLVVTDTAGATARYDFQYTVTDPRQSTVSMSVAPGSIWPPNHKYVPVTVNAVFHPSQCGGTNSVAPTVGGYVESNQPDEANSGPNNGDGNFTDDIRVTRPDRTVLVSSNAQPRVPFNPLTDKLEVRAERSGANGGERVYTITMTANGTAVATSRVVVAHDQSGKH